MTAPSSATWSTFRWWDGITLLQRKHHASGSEYGSECGFRTESVYGSKSGLESGVWIWTWDSDPTYADQCTYKHIIVNGLQKLTAHLVELQWIMQIHKRKQGHYLHTLTTYRQIAETEDAVVHNQLQTHAANSSDNSEDSDNLYTMSQKTSTFLNNSVKN